jgi:acyl dehydratase
MENTLRLQELEQERLFWEDLAVGQAFTTPSRTVTEADLVNFACLSADFNRLHVDAEYAAGTVYGQRVAHGMLVVSLMSGLTTRMLLNQFLDKSIVGLLDMRCRFPKPTFIGDTIRVLVEVADKKETSKPDRGVVVFRRRALNQRDETVVEGEWTLMIQRRD